MMTTAGRYIGVSNDARNKLMKVFGCTEKMVRLALTYRSDSDLARRIRHTALKNYGGMNMAQLPECETIHVVAEGDRRLMRQAFDNGAMLEADKGTGEVVVFNRKGEQMGRWENVDIPTLGEIQVFAAGL